VVVHTFNLSTWKAEAGGFLSWSPAWSTQRNPVSNKTKQNKTKQNKTKQNKTKQNKQRNPKTYTLVSLNENYEALRHR
jgi:hypothetical protein